MDKNSYEFTEMIYELASGAYSPDSDVAVNHSTVVNEYEEGAFCGEAYKEVFAACERLCDRLGVPFGEDEDIECIIDNMTEIQKVLCMKMYEYGWYFAKGGDGNQKESTDSDAQ